MHHGVVFVANGQAGNDVINGSLSSLPLILFGDEGDDTLISGAGDDVVFGDFGRVFWNIVTNESSGEFTTVALAGGGGPGDLTDGIIRTVSEVVSVRTHEGGSDLIELNGGRDVGIGGMLNDTIDGGHGSDIVIGDSVRITYYADSSSPEVIASIDCFFGGFDTLIGGPGEVDYIIGGGFADEIWGNSTHSDDGQDTDGSDLVFGDHAKILLLEEPPLKLIQGETIFANCTGGDDTIILGPGDDVAFGGAGNDLILGNEGQDILFGDFGIYDANSDYPQYKSYTAFPEFAGNDTIYGGALCLYCLTLVSNRINIF